MFIKRFSRLRKGEIYPVVILLAVAILSHWRWFDLTSNLSFSDWQYWPAAATKEALVTWGAWLTYGLGSQNIQIPFLSFVSIWSLLAHIGLSYDFGTKLTFFIPIALLGFISPYILMRKMTGHTIAALTAALVYGSNTYFLVRQTAHLPIAMVYALAPLILWRFIIALDQKTVRNWLWFGLLFCVGVGYEIRIMYIVAIILGLYYCVTRLEKIKQDWVWAAGIGAFIVAANAFWLLPTLLGGGASSIAETANRGLFGNFLFDILHAFTAADSSWTGAAPNQDFIPQSIPIYLWLVPMLAFGSFFVRKRLSRPETRHLLFFALLGIVGIFLTKQSADPLPDVYSWLYVHMPGFSLFREASKFYLITSLGYAGMLSYLVLGVARSRRRWRHFCTGAIVAAATIISLLNLSPLITGKIGTLFSPRHMPQDYKLLQTFIDNQQDFFRTYWAPKGSIWAPYSSQHPMLDGASLVGQDWGKYALQDQAGKNLPIQDQIANLTSDKVAQTAFNNTSIKYVIIPFNDPANDDTPFKSYGNNRDYYVKALSAVSWLKRIDIGARNLIIYENLGYKPHLVSSDNILALDNILDLSSKVSFLAYTGRSLPNFTEQGPNTGKLEQLNSLFSQPSLSKDRASLNYNVTSKSGGSATLYKNTGETNLGYTSTPQTLTFYTRDAADPQLNGQPIGFGNDRKQIISTVSLTKQNQYLLLDDTLVPVKANQSQTLGRVSNYKSVGLYTTGANEVPNGSFENGPWQAQVGDCNKYDNQHVLAMSLESSARTDGNWALQLEATNHVACTGTKFSVTPAGKAILHLDYQGIGTKQAGFHLQFNDPAGTVIKSQLATNDSNWHSLDKLMTVPAGATSAALTVYAYSSDGRTNNVVRYDNISLSNMVLDKKIALPKLASGFVGNPAPLKPGTNTFAITTDGYDTGNRVPDPSFESGLWGERVSDCNNYDRNGKIAMLTNTHEKTDGSKSLQLEATRHNACSGVSFGIDGLGNYLMSFDYQGAAGGYTVQFNDAGSTSFSEHLTDGVPGVWKTMSRQIKVPAGASQAALTVYSYESNGRANNVMRYDNFSFRRIPELGNTYFLVTKPTQKLAEPQKVGFARVSSTTFEGAVSGASNSFILNFAEAFNAGWALYLKPVEGLGQTLAGPLPDSAHIKINGYANGWIVDPSYIKSHYPPQYWRQDADGSMDFHLVIYFQPQSWFYVGLAVSGITLGAAGLYLMWQKRRRRRKRVAEKEAPSE